MPAPRIHPGAQGSQEFPGLLELEFGIVRFNAQEETGLAGQIKLGNVEQRMIGMRETVQREHAKCAGQTRAEDGEFKGNGDKRWPGIEGAAADVDGVTVGGGVNLHEESGEASANSAEEEDQGDAVAREAEGLIEAGHGEGGQGVEAEVAGVARLTGGVDEGFGGVEFREQAVHLPHAFHAAAL